MTETKTPEEIITDAVWAFCIREGRPATAKDISVETGRSPTWVRKHWTNVGGRNGIVCCNAYVERREKSYGSRIADQRVDALRPTWEAMAGRLREADARISAAASREHERAASLRGTRQHLPHVLVRTLDWCVDVVRGSAPMPTVAGDGDGLERDPSCTRCVDGRTQNGVLCRCVVEATSDARHDQP